MKPQHDPFDLAHRFKPRCDTRAGKAAGVVLANPHRQPELYGGMLDAHVICFSNHRLAMITVEAAAEAVAGRPVGKSGRAAGGRITIRIG